MSAREPSGAGMSGVGAADMGSARAPALPAARAHPGRMLSLALVAAIFALLAAAPFLFGDVRSIQVAARICIFIALAASYDLLLGCAGIVSFAHVTFFGLGAYGAGIALRQMGPGWDAVLLGGGGGIAAALVLAVAIGLLSLRVKAIFFAMVTLAAASVAAVLASQLSGLTGGEDGITYKAPDLFKPATKLLVDEDGKVLTLWGVRMTGKVAAYWFVFLGGLSLYLLAARLAGSPFGSVLRAIRENEARAEAIGYRVVAWRTAAFAISAGMAAAAGVFYAVWLKYVGPDTVLSMSIMMDVLLMVVIGGMGTISGAAVGASLLTLAHYYLRDVMESASEAAAGLPLLPELLSPDRWLLWLGICFILVVYFLPRGIVGTLEARLDGRGVRARGGAVRDG